MKVALDLDDVIGAFYPGFCKWSQRPELKTNIWDGKNSCKWIVDTIHKVDNDPEFWKGLKFLSNPNSINFHVEAYITASPEKMLLERAYWLFGRGFPEAPLIHSKDKLKTMKMLDIDILVDDSPSTIDKVNEGGLIGLQFKPAYMEKEIDDKSRIITHLSEVGTFIEKNKSKIINLLIY